jgi:hypothetical protein
MNFILAVKQMIEFILKIVIEKFYPIPPPKTVSFSPQTRKPDGYKNSLSSSTGL